MVYVTHSYAPCYQSVIPPQYHNQNGHYVLMTNPLYNLVEGEFNMADLQIDVNARGEERGVNT